MAAIVRRNWPAVLILACAGVLVLSLALPHAFQPSSVVQATEPSAERTFMPLAAEDYGALRNLRDELGLDNDALIALNLTPEATEQILAAMRGWYEQNKATLQAHDVTVGQKALALRKIEAKIRMGPRDEAVLASRPPAVQEVNAARSARQAFLEGLVTAVGAQLTSKQAAAVATLRANRNEPMPYRQLALTDQQKTALRTARRRYAGRSATAQDAQSRESAIAAWNEQLATILTSTQQRTLAAFAEYAPAAAERVLAAEHKVLHSVDEAPIAIDDIATTNAPQG